MDSPRAKTAARTDKQYFLIVGITLYKRFSSKDDAGVSKPVLGRKLGTLLKAEEGKEVNSTLLRTHVPDFSRPKPEEVVTPAPEAEAAAERSGIPRWYWLGADLLLVVFALLILYKSPAPWPAAKEGLAVGAVVLGGGLALWGLRWPEGK